MGGGHPVVGRAGMAGMMLALALTHARPVGGQASELEVYDTVPARSKIRLRVGERQQFAIWARGEGLRHLWTLDGEPVGDRASWTLEATPVLAGSRIVAVMVEGPAGRAYRTWRVRIDVPPGATIASTSTTAPTSTTTSTTAVSTSTTVSTTQTTTTTTRGTTTTTRRGTTTTSRTTTTRSTTSTTSTTASTSTTTSATTTTSPRTGVSESEVRALLERYAAAWRQHDVATLQAIGQVTTSGQEEALRSYFQTVGDLEVDVTVLEIRPTGDEAIVRFIRRDRFRDPGGTTRTQESPPITKRVIRTRQGLRFAPAS